MEGFLFNKSLRLFAEKAVVLLLINTNFVLRVLIISFPRYIIVQYFLIQRKHSKQQNNIYELFQNFILSYPFFLEDVGTKPKI